MDENPIAGQDIPPAESPNPVPLLTVALEDYFQVGAFNQLIQRGQWYRFEARLEQSTLRTLDLLEAHGLHATFFVLGWVAEQVPELIRRVADRGHEIASKGYYHRSIQQMTPSEFREDLTRAREALERASGQRVMGYRVADNWFRPADLWALDVLAEEGYEYDSSIAPLFRRFAAEPWRRFAHPHLYADRVLWEFPISTVQPWGIGLPIAGGNYFRQFPHFLMRRAVDHCIRNYSAPFVMYFHVWELDPDQPKIQAASWLTRIRQYRGLAKMPRVLDDYFSRYRFTSMANYLGFSTAPTLAHPVPEVVERDRGSAEVTIATDRRSATIVVPCYNEELILPYLSNTLKGVEKNLAGEFALQFIFVDDGSSDGTWVTLRHLFDDWPNARLIRHEGNRGVAEGILSGIRACDTEVVCSIDCDCTYDPHELGPMIHLLSDDVDMVTASPYHEDGEVRNVPRWRLVLSRCLSLLYRLVLRNKLATYTSCFRVYRREAVVGLQLDRRGFLGVTEMLGRMDLMGRRIVEYPTTLEVRILGRSKMKILGTIVGHLGLLTALTRRRLGPAASRAGTRTPPPDQSSRQGRSSRSASDRASV